MPNKLTRRDFLRIGVIGGSAAVLTGCKFPRRWAVLEPYVTPPEQQVAGQPTFYASTCRQCPAGCGIMVRVMNGRALKLEGNPEHPLNQGKLCARGQAGLQVLYNPDRLDGPLTQSARGTRDYKSLSWDAAINLLAEKLQAAGKNVAVWLGSTTSGHLYDLFQRYLAASGAQPPVVYDLYTAFNGYNVLAQASQTVFAQNQLPAYPIHNADVVFSFGSDFLGTWLSAVRYGVEYGQFRSQALGKRGYLVQFEPRMTATGAKADRWFPVQPGSEGLVAAALVKLIADGGFGPAERVQRAKQLAGTVDVQAAASAAGISTSELTSLARFFAEAASPMAIPGNDLTGAVGEVDATAAVQALNAVASAAGPVFTAAPPAKGLVKPPISTIKEANTLIDAMASGEISVLLVYGANPAYELPQKDAFTAALKQVPFVVSFASIPDETAVWADLILPDRTYLESWGYEVVSPAFGTPVVGSQQPVVSPVYDLRAAGDVLLTVAKAVPAAAKALPWADEVEFIKETITQLPPGANGGSAPDVLWSRFQQHGGWWPAQPQPVAAQLAPNAAPVQASLPPADGSPQEYPYNLHIYLSPLLSDGRGANQPWLQGSPDINTTIAWQTWVEINPATASKLGLKKGDVVKITSPYDSLEAEVYVYPGVRPDTVAIPLGQGHTDYGRYAQQRGANVMKLLNPRQNPQVTDLAYAGVHVKIEPTGKIKYVATFENTPGVEQGFPNQSIPGF